MCGSYPYSENRYGSGSTKLLNTDPIRIGSTTLAAYLMLFLLAHIVKKKLCLLFDSSLGADANGRFFYSAL